MNDPLLNDPVTRRRLLQAGTLGAAGLSAWPDPLSAQSPSLPIEGYADKISYLPGEEVAFHISSKAPLHDIEIARFGADRKVVWSREGIPGKAHPAPANASCHGCGWPESLRVKIGDDWPSGYYEALPFVVVDGKRVGGSVVPFVIRPTHPGKEAAILMHITTNTYSAYTNWGGYSLYAFNARNKVQGRRVSLNRPLRSQFASWEMHFVQWAEKAGYRIDYVANEDLEFHPELFKHYKLVVSAGHDEYWSWAMRENMEKYLAGGGNAAFFTGNTICWQVRFEDEGRAMVCWKQAYKEDPVYKTGPMNHVSTLWSHKITDHPETKLLGAGFLFGGFHRSHGQLMDGSGAYTVHRPDHWVFAGTGVNQGQEFGGKDTIVGYECDGCEIEWKEGLPHPTGSDGSPKDFLILATAPAIWHPDDCEWYEHWEKGRKGYGCMGIRTVPGGGTIFSASTTDWPHGLRTPDPVVDRITRNILNRLSGQSL